MIKNMQQVNKMLEHVNKDMNAAELAKVMEQFEKVCFLRKNKNKILLCFSLDF